MATRKSHPAKTSPHERKTAASRPSRLFDGRSCLTMLGLVWVWLSCGSWLGMSMPLSSSCSKVALWSCPLVVISLPTQQPEPRMPGIRHAIPSGSWGCWVQELGDEMPRTRPTRQGQLYTSNLQHERVIPSYPVRPRQTQPSKNSKPDFNNGSQGTDNPLLLIEADTGWMILFFHCFIHPLLLSLGLCCLTSDGWVWTLHLVAHSFLAVSKPSRHHVLEPCWH